ncbi:MAG: P-loop NTPase, partial [Lachnospiraceae bacterium]|nr:P-loop NTPase [Lachnospiraceae bacterium]
FVDMPPGTGDVPLTVFQSLPIDGIIIVASPQELVGMIVEKAVKMAEMMNIPIFGIVENMSYFECPNCKEKHYIYGDSHIDEIAAIYGIKNVAKIPMNSKLAGACDKGMIELFEGDWLNDFAQELKKI